MNTLKKLALVAAASLGLQACDPYTSENKGPPVILSILGVSGDPDAQIGTGAVDATAPTTAGGAWTLSGMPATDSVIFVKTNKLLDGASIQATPADCSPANGWLHVNGAAATGWMTCYNPASPSPNEGSSVVIYQGTTPKGGPLGTGWFGQTANVPGVYRITGAVADKQGHALDINIDTLIADPPAITNVTATSADVTVVATDPGTTHTLQREAPGATTWTDLSTAAGLFADTGLTPGAEYSYRVTYVGQTLTFVGPTATACTLPVAPAAPTVTKVSGTEATIAWTTTGGATSWKVERAPESTTTAGTPGTFAVLATVTAAPLTYDNTAIAPGTYFYRITAVSDCKSVAHGAVTAAVVFP